MTSPNRKAGRRAGADAEATLVKPLSRGISSETTVSLYARAGGFCEFRGCQTNILEHHVTKASGNFGERAHIYAFSDRGPRADETGRPSDLNGIDNLMLLCQRCHKLVDDHPLEFPVAALRLFKAEHEERIRRAALLSPDVETVVMVVTAPIRGTHVVVPRNHVIEAISPRYPSSSDFLTVSLSDLDGEREGASFNELACRKIDRAVAALFAPEGPISRTPQLSLFAIAPMAILAYLGAKLENKVPLQVFQKHRGTPENWTWRPDGPDVRYVVRKLREGGPGERVSVVFSLSGTIRLADLPADVRDGATVYEMHLEGQTPAPTFLRRECDLSGFVRAYHDLLGVIAAEHGYVDAIDVFPAVPAPVAVLIGRERLMKRHPSLRMYDADKDNGGFTFQLEVK